MNKPKEIVLDKSNFQQDTRYTITLIDDKKKLRPANLYVMRLHNDGMVVRMTDKAAVLVKIRYEDVVKIVSSKKVLPNDYYISPEAILNEDNWKDRTILEHYSSSPHMGK